MENTKVYKYCVCKSNMEKEKKEYVRTAPIQVGANITPDLHELAMINGIGWSDALKFGVQFLVAEKGDYQIDFPENVLSERVKNASNKIYDVNEENAVLRKQIEILNKKLGNNPTDAENEAEDFMAKNLDQEMNEILGLEDQEDGSSK